MILLSNGGTNSHRADALSDAMVVGTVDGVALLERSPSGWAVKQRALQGCAVSAVTALDDGTLFAATHGVGVARSDDGGLTWSWSNDGLAHFDLWSARAGRLMGRSAVFVGALPAHLYVSEDAGKSWRELPALRRVSSVSQWCFPPPPRIGHVKDIVIDGDRLLVGIEIGALLVSNDFGESFTELPVEPNARECDIHRILVHHARPERIISTDDSEKIMKWFADQREKRRAALQVAEAEEADILEVVRAQEGDGEGGAGEEQERERDALFREAAEACIQNQGGSTSLLQRRLRIGYGRAARIIDQLHYAGILGPPDGRKPREVLVGFDQLDEYCG